MNLLKRKILIGFITILVVCALIVLSISISPTKELKEIEENKTIKQVIVITVDSLMNEPLQKAIEQGKAPAFSFLINNGKLFSEVVSSYPTMSVTIDSTIITGVYPDQHKVPGLIWFKEDENRMISYGSGISEIWNNGVRNVADDSVIHLNNDHLSKEVETIYEQLANENLQSASINGLIYRGDVVHQLNVPKLISMFNLLPNDIDVSGPDLLSIGALSQYNPKNKYHKFVWERLGVNNEFTVNELSYLIKKEQLPPFTLAYFPDADAKIHKNGPQDLKGIVKADEALQKLLNNFSTWEEAIQEVTWIVLGDSGQSSVKKDKDIALIDLNKLLKDYTFWEGEKVDSQLAIAINERMAYIYINDQHVEISEVVNNLKSDDRIGFIAWKDDEKNYVVSPKKDEVLTFSQEGSYVDEYNQSWNIDGDISILDLTISGGSKVQYKDYPDALARLNGALHSQEGRVIIVDANPSYEFIEEHSHDHAGGGAHGSLHKVDSIVPLIITGTDEIPEYLRLVDIKNYILKLEGG